MSAKSEINNFFISRQRKDNKSNVITIRLTEKEAEKLNQLKEEMEFKSLSDLFLFLMDVTDKLFGWQRSNYKFYIGDPEKKDSLQEVQFEFIPGN